MTTTSERLNDQMENRRLDLGLTWEQVAEQASMTSTNLRAIRRGSTQPSRLGERRLEDALQWRHGSIANIRNGGAPEPSQRPGPTREQVADYIAFLEDYADSRGITTQEAFEQIKAQDAADRKRGVESRKRSRNP